MNKEQIANKYKLSFDKHQDNMVINAMFAIKKHNMDTWIREFDEPNGFIISTHNNISILQEELTDDGHSGCSAACTLRMCQALLTKEYNDSMSQEKNNENPETNIEILPECNIEPINTRIVTEDIDHEAIKGAGKSYQFYDRMDEHNKEAMDVAASHGMKAAVEFMTKDIRDGKMDYATMRSLYG
tara:strand:- start:4662 stop:5216 length:555 start_codon:yes stop_codon:yes gene_type:complete